VKRRSVASTTGSLTGWSLSPIPPPAAIRQETRNNPMQAPANAFRRRNPMMVLDRTSEKSVAPPGHLGWLNLHAGFRVAGLVWYSGSCKSRHTFVIEGVGERRHECLRKIPTVHVCLF